MQRGGTRPDNAGDTGKAAVDCEGNAAGQRSRPGKSRGEGVRGRGAEN